MKVALYLVLFLGVFGIFFYLFYINSHQSVVVFLWSGVQTPSLPLGLVLVVSFLLGVILGIILSLLTWVIKKLSS